jgi:hypothetical protein
MTDFRAFPDRTGRALSRTFGDLFFTLNKQHIKDYFALNLDICYKAH